MSKHKKRRKSQQRSWQWRQQQLYHQMYCYEPMISQQSGVGMHQSQQSVHQNQQWAHQLQQNHRTMYEQQMQHQFPDYQQFPGRYQQQWTQHSYRPYSRCPQQGRLSYSGSVRHFDNYRFNRNASTSGERNRFYSVETKNPSSSVNLRYQPYSKSEKISHTQSENKLSRDEIKQKSQNGIISKLSPDEGHEEMNENVDENDTHCLDGDDLENSTGESEKCNDTCRSGLDINDIIGANLNDKQSNEPDAKIDTDASPNEKHSSVSDVTNNTDTSLNGKHHSTLDLKNDSNASPNNKHTTEPNIKHNTEARPSDEYSDESNVKNNIDTSPNEEHSPESEVKKDIYTSPNDDHSTEPDVKNDTDASPKDKHSTESDVKNDTDASSEDKHSTKSDEKYDTYARQRNEHSAQSDVKKDIDPSSNEEHSNESDYKNDIDTSPNDDHSTEPDVKNNTDASSEDKHSTKSDEKYDTDASSEDKHSTESDVKNDTDARQSDEYSAEYDENNTDTSPNEEHSTESDVKNDINTSPNDDHSIEPDVKNDTDASPEDKHSTESDVKNASNARPNDEDSTESDTKNDTDSMLNDKNSTEFDVKNDTDTSPNSAEFNVKNGSGRNPNDQHSTEFGAKNEKDKSPNEGNSKETDVKNDTDTSPNDKPTCSLKCDDCSFRATHPLALEKHKLHHKLPSAYKCRWCSYSASSSSTKAHEKRCHENNILSAREHAEDGSCVMENLYKYYVISQGRFICPYCIASFESRTFFRQHLMGLHKLTPKKQCFSCELCDFRTLSKQKLNKHKSTEHHSLHRYCDNCDFTTVSQQEFDSHKERHLNVSKVMCSKCNYSSNENNVYRHERKDHEMSMKPGSWRYYVHSSKRYECPLCHYFSRSHNSFQTHLSCHEKSFKYKCELCNYSSNSHKMIDKHCHLNPDKPKTVNLSRTTTHAKHKCDACEFSTSSIEMLHAHNKYHNEGNGVIKCSKCTYSSNFFEPVLRHYKMDHSSMVNKTMSDHSYSAPQVKNKKRNSPMSLSFSKRFKKTIAQKVSPLNKSGTDGSQDHDHKTAPVSSVTTILLEQHNVGNDSALQTSSEDPFHNSPIPLIPDSSFWNIAYDLSGEQDVLQCDNNMVSAGTSSKSTRICKNTNFQKTTFEISADNFHTIKNDPINLSCSKETTITSENLSYDIQIASDYEEISDCDENSEDRMIEKMYLNDVTENCRVNPTDKAEDKIDNVVQAYNTDDSMKGTQLESQQEMPLKVGNESLDNSAPHHSLGDADNIPVGQYVKGNKIDEEIQQHILDNDTNAKPTCEQDDHIKYEVNDAPNGYTQEDTEVICGPENGMESSGLDKALYAETENHKADNNLNKMESGVGNKILDDASYKHSADNATRTGTHGFENKFKSSARDKVEAHCVNLDDDLNKMESGVGIKLLDDASYNPSADDATNAGAHGPESKMEYSTLEEAFKDAKDAAKVDFVENSQLGIKSACKQNIVSETERSGGASSNCFSDMKKQISVKSVICNHNCSDVDVRTKQSECCEDFDINDIISSCVVNIQSAHDNQTLDDTNVLDPKVSDPYDKSKLICQKMARNQHVYKQNDMIDRSEHLAKSELKDDKETNRNKEHLSQEAVENMETNDHRKSSQAMNVSCKTDSNKKSCLENQCKTKSIQTMNGETNQQVTADENNNDQLVKPDNLSKIKRKSICLKPLDEGDKFQCPHCDMAYSLKSKLINHQKIHQDDEIITSQHCKTKTCQYSTYSYSYSQQIKGQPWSCSICGFGASSIKGMKHHMGLHGIKQWKWRGFIRKFGGIKKVKSTDHRFHIYKCSKCGMKSKRFRTVQHHKLTCNLNHQSLDVNSARIHKALEKHPNERGRDILSQTERTTYKCHICQYSTLLSGCLVKHMKNHNSQGGCFVCDYCNFSSFHSSRVRKHKKRDHKIMKMEFVEDEKVDTEVARIEDNLAQVRHDFSQSQPKENVDQYLTKKQPHELCEEVIELDEQESQKNHIQHLETRTCEIRLPRIDKEIAKMCKKTKVDDDDDENVGHETVPEEFPMDYESTDDTDYEAFNLFTCSACPYFTKFTGYFHRHTLHHRIQRGIKCKYCTYSSDHWKSMSRHRRWHNKAKKGM